MRVDVAEYDVDFADHIPDPVLVLGFDYRNVSGYGADLLDQGVLHIDSKQDIQSTCLLDEGKGGGGARPPRMAESAQASNFLGLY